MNLKSNESTLANVGQFNWGACLLTWIWAVGNRCLNIPTVALTLCSFLPYVGIVFALTLVIYSGKTGGQRAWSTGRWKSVESFERSQRNWALGGVIVLACFVLMLVLFAALGDR